MKLDPILQEIRDYRDAYAARFNGDVKAMLADLWRRQEESGRPVVSRAPRRIERPNDEPAKPE